MRLYDLIESQLIIGYHATDKDTVELILKNGFTSSNDAIWFNETPNIGMDDAYIISANLDVKNAYTDYDFDPDDHEDNLAMIDAGYDGWIGESNVGEGNDVVVFSSNQVSNIQYYGKRIINDDYEVEYI
jgi:hypothetical protein